MSIAYESKKHQKLQHFLNHQFHLLASTIQKNQDPEKVSQLIAERIYAIGKKFDLENYVYAIKDPSRSPKYNIKYSGFFSVKIANLRESTVDLNFEELGHLMTLISQISYVGNRIDISGSTTPMKRLDIRNLLQISDDKCSKLLQKFISLKLLTEGDSNSKLTLYCSYDFAHQKNPLENTSFVKMSKVEYPQTIKVFKRVLDNPLFKKENKENRKSSGKETLGVYFRLVFLMNQKQEIRTRSKTKIIPFLERKLNLSDIRVHLDQLININYIQIQDNIVYVNPEYSKYFTKTFTEEVKNIFNIRITQIN